MSYYRRTYNLVGVLRSIFFTLATEHQVNDSAEHPHRCCSGGSSPERKRERETGNFLHKRRSLKANQHSDTFFFFFLPLSLEQTGSLYCPLLLLRLLFPALLFSPKKTKKKFFFSLPKQELFFSLSFSARSTSKEVA